MVQMPVISRVHRHAVSLRQLVLGDAERLFKLIDQNRSHLSQYGDETAASCPNEDSVLRMISNHTNPGLIRFGVWLHDELVGYASIWPEHPMFGGGGQIGYWIGMRHQGRGIMTAVVHTLVDYARNELGWFLLAGYLHEKNEASYRVLYKAGFRRNGERQEPLIKMRMRLR